MVVSPADSLSAVPIDETKPISLRECTSVHRCHRLYQAKTYRADLAGYQILGILLAIE
jgi:hypothetical protein